MRYIPPDPSTRFLSDDSSPAGPTRTDRIAALLSEVPISVFSTTAGPNASGETGQRGQIGVERGSSGTHLWVATGDGRGVWEPLTTSTASGGGGGGGAVPSHTHDRSDLPSTIAYVDEANVFQREQQISLSDLAAAVLLIDQQREGSSSRLSLTTPEESWRISNVTPGDLLLASSQTTALRASALTLSTPLAFEAFSDSSISGAFLVRGPAALESTLTVASDASLGGTLSVLSDLHAHSAATIDGSFSASSSVSIRGPLHVLSDATIDSDLSVGGLTSLSDASLRGTLHAMGAIDTLSTLTVASDASFGSALTVSGLIASSASTLRLLGSHTPSSGTDSGRTGDIAWDSSFLYVCSSTSSWRRATLNAF